MRRTLIFLPVLVVVVVALAYSYFFTGPPITGPRLTLKDVPVSSIDLCWFGSNRTITASARCAQVVQSMCKARQSPPPASIPLGTMTLHYSDGTTNSFDIENGGMFSVAISCDSGGYAISKREILNTFESVGLLTKEQW
jgi:hypothetical protein